MPGQFEKGTKLGQYEIVKPLGRGGMASVFRAYQPNLDREVAIKVMAEQFTSNPAFVERFRREARSVARLQHPNILTVYDAGEEDNRLYIVMELIEGETLKEELNGKPLSLERTAQILSQVASALDYANSNGIIHRDVKPTNVLMSKSGRAVLSDFGIAKMAEANTQLTGTGVGVGTPDYMSPEQAMGDELDARSDEYSLAVMVYEMLTGRVPFTGDTPIAIVMGHVNKPLPSVRSTNPTIPVAVEQVLNKALAKKTAERYESCGAFERAFAQAVNNPASLPPEVVPTQFLPTTTSNEIGAEQLYQQARNQEQQNNFYAAFDTFTRLNLQFPNYRDVPSLVERYYQMGYGNPSGVGSFPVTPNPAVWQPPRTPAPVNYYANTPPPVSVRPVQFQTPPPANYYATGSTPPPGTFTPPPPPVGVPRISTSNNRNKLIGGVGLLMLITIIALAMALSSNDAKKVTVNLPPVVIPTPPIAIPTSAQGRSGLGSAGGPSGPGGSGGFLQPRGLEFVRESYSKDGLSLPGYSIRPAQGSNVFIYGALKNETNEPLLVSGSATFLDASGKELDKDVSLMTLRIIEANSTVPFEIFSQKGKEFKKINWDFKAKSARTDSSSKLIYSSSNFKLEDYRPRDPALGPAMLIGKVTNTGPANATNIQVMVAVFGPDGAPIYISTPPLKDKDLASKASNTFELELPDFPREIDAREAKFSIWFEGQVK